MVLTSCCVGNDWYGSCGGSWHRFCFLLHKYNAPMDYGDGTMTQAVNIEKIFSEFFHNVKATLRRYGGGRGCGGGGGGLCVEPVSVGTTGVYDSGV